jgi:succinate dehydrogenase / fumarate reductase, iron-sulfur subunit
MCGAVVNGRAHGSQKGHHAVPAAHAPFRRTATPSSSNPGAPGPFKVIKDLDVDRSAFDKIIQAGGYISVNTGGAPDANAIPDTARRRPKKPWMPPPASAAAPVWPPVPMLGHAVYRGQDLPSGSAAPGAAGGRPRALNMLATMDELGFGNCSNERECEAACPKEISIVNIAA